MSIWLTWAYVPSRMDALAFQRWMIQFSTSLKNLREEMAAWSDCLANESPPWAAHRAIMAAHLVALEKCPGVRLVGIREGFCCLLANLVLRSRGAQAKEAFRNVNLCASLKEGIEEPIHAFKYHEEWVRGETGEERREILETEDQERLIIELVRKREMRKSGSKLTTIPDERGGV